MVPKRCKWHSRVPSCPPATCLPCWIALKPPWTPNQLANSATSRASGPVLLFLLNWKTYCQDWENFWNWIDWRWNSTTLVRDGAGRWSMMPSLLDSAGYASGPIGQVGQCSRLWLGTIKFADSPHLPRLKPQVRTHHTLFTYFVKWFAIDRDLISMWIILQ